MKKRILLQVSAVALMGGCIASAAYAEDTIKIGLVLPMTGQFASTGRQIDAAVKL